MVVKEERSLYRLENDRLAIAAVAEGAELQSVVDKSTGREWLWQGDGRWWGKRAPVLFPFVGCLKGGSYTWKGKQYAMTKHGFARDRVFRCVSKDDAKGEMVFSLTSDENSLAIYPFPFELRIIYRLRERGLEVIHEVYNLGEDEMVFSLGGHPAFNCMDDAEDWELIFEKQEKLMSYPINLQNGLIQHDSYPVSLKEQSLPLRAHLFEKDALIFENTQSNKVVLRRSDGSLSMTFDYSGFPMIALWSPMGPFLCLEPWFGMADFEDHSGALEEKYGAVRLEAGKKFSCMFTLGF